MEKFDPVQMWIDNVAYSHSKSEYTGYNYRKSLELFCKFLGKTPEQILEEYESMKDRKFRRKYAFYIRALISRESRNGYAVGSVRTVVSAIKSFFKYNDLPLGHVPVAAAKITFHNRDMAKDEIVSILEGSKPRDRAFFSMMAQGGQRPITLCNLRLKHIQPEFSRGTIPCKIEVPEEIAKGEFGAYFSFMGEESVKYLKAYLAIRPGIDPEDYLFTAHGLDKKASPKSLTRIFARTIDKLKKKGVMDFKDRQYRKPSEVRLYNLRKYFRNQARQAGVEYVNFWMGHRTNYKAPHIPASDEHYFSREDIEFQRQLYAEKAMPFLRLETATPSEMEKTITDLRGKVAELNEKLEKREALSPLLQDIERMSRVPSVREAFESIVEEAKVLMAERLKRQKIE